MKEATGEVSMTVITLVAIAVIGGILAVMWPTIQESIAGLWGNVTTSGAHSPNSVPGNSESGNSGSLFG